MTSFHFLFLSVMAVVILMGIPTQSQPGVPEGATQSNQGFSNLPFPEPSAIRSQMANLPLPPGMAERNEAANNPNSNPNPNPNSAYQAQDAQYQQPYQPQPYQQQPYPQQGYQQQAYPDSPVAVPNQQPYPQQGYQQQAYPFPSPDSTPAAGASAANMGIYPNPAFSNSPSDQANMNVPMYQSYPAAAATNNPPNMPMYQGAPMDPNLNTITQQQQQAPFTMPMYQGNPNTYPAIDPTGAGNSPAMPMYPTYAGAGADAGGPNPMEQQAPNFPNLPMYQGGYNPTAPMDPNVNMPLYQGQQPQAQGMPTMFIEADADAETETEVDANADADTADVDDATSNPQHAVPSAAHASSVDVEEDFDTLQFGGPGFPQQFQGRYGGYGEYQGGKKQQQAVPYGLQGGYQVGQPTINNKVTINKFADGIGPQNGLGAQNGVGALHGVSPKIPTTQPQTTISASTKPHPRPQTVTTYAQPITKPQIQKETQTVPVKQTKTTTQYKTRYTQVKVPKQITRKTVQPIITQPVIRRTIVKQPIITPVVQTQEIIKPKYHVVPKIQKTTLPQYSTAKPIVETTTVQGKPQYNKPVYTTLPPITTKQGQGQILQNGQYGQYGQAGYAGQYGQHGQNGKGAI